MKTRAIVTIGAIAVGVCLGIWHFSRGAQAIFVFRENEPVTSWLAVVFGFGAALPGTLVAAWKPMLGSILLICSSAIALIALIVHDAPSLEHLGPFVAQVTLPVVAVGIAFMLLDLGRSGKHAT